MSIYILLLLAVLIYFTDKIRINSRQLLEQKFLIIEDAFDKKFKNFVFYSLSGFVFIVIILTIIGTITGGTLLFGFMYLVGKILIPISCGIYIIRIVLLYRKYNFPKKYKNQRVLFSALKVSVFFCYLYFKN